MVHTGGGGKKKTFGGEVGLHNKFDTIRTMGRRERPP